MLLKYMGISGVMIKLLRLDNMMYKIPTYDDVREEWSYTFFSNKAELIEFMLPLFKEPGKYNFDKTSLELFVISLDFSVSGISIVSLILDCESSDPGVGSDCFF